MLISQIDRYSHSPKKKLRMAKTKESGRLRKERVVWKAHELQAVIDAAVLASLEDIEHVWVYLARGQQVLPKERHRVIGGKHVVTSEILAAFQVARKALIDREVPAPPPPVEIPVPVEQSREQVLESLTDAELIQLAVKRFTPLIEGLRALGEVGGKKETSPPKPVVECPPAAILTPSPAKLPKPTVVFLFGFTPDQEVEIRRRAGSFNLQLIFARQERGDAPPKVPVCNWCIVAESDLSRRARTAIKARIDDAHILYIRSVDTTMQKLADINSRTK